LLDCTGSGTKIAGTIEDVSKEISLLPSKSQTCGSSQLLVKPSDRLIAVSNVLAIARVKEAIQQNAKLVY